MKHAGVNGFAPICQLADQLARPIVGHRKLIVDDWEALREYARLLGRSTRRVTPYIPAPVTDEQADRDFAVDSREWCGND